MVLRLLFISCFISSFAMANKCGEVDQSLIFCKNPKAFICQTPKSESEKVLDRNLKTIHDYAAELFFEENRELLERQGVYQIDEKAFDKLEKLMVQCKETEAEIQGVCEDSKFFGKDVNDFYSSSKAQKTSFKDQFLIDLEITFMDVLDDIVFQNEEKLEDIATGMMGHFVDAINEEVQSYYHLEPGKAKRVSTEIEKRMNEVVFIFSRQSSRLAEFSSADQNHIMNEYNKICGVFSDADNAFAISKLRPNKSVMIICPGAYLRQDILNPLNFESTEILPRIAGTIFHELSHFLNTKPNFALNEFIKSINPINNQPSGLENCQKENFKLTTAIKNNYPNFREEIEADVIGNIAFGKYLKSSNLSINQKLDLIKIAYGDICGTSDTVPHPGDDFRLNELLLRTPEIFNEFRCYRAYQNVPMVGCGITGHKTLNLVF